MLLVVITTLIMLIFTLLGQFIVHLFLPEVTRFTSILYLVIVGGIAVVIYGALALITRLLDKMFGEKSKRLRERLHLDF